jgi:Flp pilus assembly protein TadD
VRLDPNDAELRYNFGNALLSGGHFHEAAAQYRDVVRLKPEHSGAQNNLGVALAAQGDVGGAIRHFRESLRLQPDRLSALNNLAWILATHANAAFRDGANAVRLAERACGLTANNDAGSLDTLAAAYAETGRFTEAVKTAERAKVVAGAAGNSQLEGEIMTRLQLYRQNQPYRQR